MGKYQRRIATYSFKGRREINEDSVGKAVFSSRGKEIVLLAVADGMGGYGGGDLSSKKAIKVFIKQMKNSLKQSIHLDRIRNYLEETYYKINSEIYRKSKSDKALEDMGTTLASLVLAGNKFLIANVGDSRAYVVKKEDIVQITEDHSALAEALKEGLYSSKQLKEMPYQNALTRNLGNANQAEVDIFPEAGSFSSEGKEIIILLTDGITSTLTELELYEQIVSNTNLKKTVKKISSLAYRKGSSDNISIAALEIGRVKRKKYLTSTIRSKIKVSKKEKIVFMISIILAFLILALLILSATNL